MRFLELTLQNFMSFGNRRTVFDLSTPGTYLIKGENKDVGGSNGSGKTSVINGICYALFNQPFDDITLNRLINTTNASKNTLMEVSLSFTKGVDEYLITRTRGAEFITTILKNGVDVTPGKGVTECDALISEIVGMTHELFTRTVVFSGNNQAFLSLPISQQRSIIEELFNIKMLSDLAMKLRPLIKQTETDISVQQAVVQQQQVAVDLHRKHLVDAATRVKRWDMDRNLSMSTIEKTLASLEGVDFEFERVLHDEVKNYTQNRVHVQQQVNDATRIKRELTKKVENLLGEERHLLDAKCPYCKQKYHDTSAKLAEINAELDKLNDSLVTVEDMELRATEDLKKVDELLADRRSRIKHPDFDKLLKAKSDAALLQEKLDDLKIQTNPHHEAFDKLNSEGEPIIETSKVDVLKKRLEHQQLLLKLLVNKDSFVRHRILNKSLPILNERMNYYTKLLGLPHAVKFQADMSCTVTEFGRELDFGNLSTGEKKRVNTAMNFAFSEVRALLHARVNLMLIDEIDGGLDPEGLEAVVKQVKLKSRADHMTIFMISHHPLIDGRLDRTILIRKEQGFSSLVE
jgi:DNA repair exonuclease SbcCD ATPase subunit